MSTKRIEKKKCKNRFTVEFGLDGGYGIYFKIIAGNKKSLLRKIRKEAIELDKMYPKVQFFVYQITKPFLDCELNQPIYDYFNGFKLFENKFKSTYWKKVSKERIK